MNSCIPETKRPRKNEVAPTDEVLDIISRHRQVEQKQFRRMQRAERPREIHREQTHYLRSWSVKVVAAFESLDRGNAGFTLTEIEALASRVDPRSPCTEPVRTERQPKKGGGCRTVTKLGRQRRALDFIVTRLLQSRFELHEAIYSIKGKGTAQAVNRIEAALPVTTHAVTGDLRRAYDSIRWREPSQLPLPRPVAEVLSNLCHLPQPPTQRRHEHQRVTARMHISLSSIPPSPFQRKVGPSTGLLTGAGASFVALAIMLRSLIEQLPPDVAKSTLVYGDDFCCLCNSKAEADAVAKTLRARVKEIPGGPTFRGLEPHDVRQGFDFLKFHFRLTDGGEVKITPSDQALSWLDNTCYTMAFTGKTIAEIAAYVSAWRSAYRAAELDEADRLWLERLPKEAWLLARQAAA